jgi:hypothetical protein
MVRQVDHVDAVTGARGAQHVHDRFEEQRVHGPVYSFNNIDRVRFRERYERRMEAERPPPESAQRLRVVQGVGLV